MAVMDIIEFAILDTPNDIHWYYPRRFMDTHFHQSIPRAGGAANRGTLGPWGCGLAGVPYFLTNFSSWKAVGGPWPVI